MSGTSTISVVIPVHNEATFLAPALDALFAELSEVPAAVDVTLAENGSTDGTAELGRELAARFPALRVLELPDPDYGKAMRAGFMAASGDWVVNFDIDYFSGAFLRQVLERAGEADLVLASKRAPGADDQRSLLRRFATFVFNLILRFVLRSKVSDTHGMKAVRRAVVQQVGPQVISNQDLFDTELVIRAERAGYRIVEVPASVEELRETKSSLLKRVPRTLRGIWKIRKVIG